MRSRRTGFEGRLRGTVVVAGAESMEFAAVRKITHRGA